MIDTKSLLVAERLLGWNPADGVFNARGTKAKIGDEGSTWAARFQSPDGRAQIENALYRAGVHVEIVLWADKQPSARIFTINGCKAFAQANTIYEALIDAAYAYVMREGTE